MLKTSILFLFFISIQLQCQEYFFNRIIVYETERGDIFFMTNEEDPTYFFSTYYSSDIQGNIINHGGNIVDYTKNIMHYFGVSLHNNDILFNYKSSSELLYDMDASNLKKRKVSINDFRMTNLDKDTLKLEVLTLMVKKRRNKITDKKVVFYFDKKEESAFHKNHIKHIAYHYLYVDYLPDYMGKLPLKIEFKYSKKFKRTYTFKKEYAVHMNLIAKAETEVEADE